MLAYAHAFASGKTYPLPARRRVTQTSLSTFVFRHLIGWLERTQVDRVVESFQNGASIGEGCRIGSHAWCVNLGLRENIRIGQNVICRGILRCENWADASHLVIGDYVYIGDDCIISCAKRVDIGRLTMLAHGVQVFDNDSHPVDPYLREQDYLTVLGQRTEPRQSIANAPIWIGERAWVGFNAIVLKGVRIGDGSVVAAGSVVTSDVPPYTVVAGNPAQVVKSFAPGE